MRNRASLNKTIKLSKKELSEFKNDILKVDKKISADRVINKIICNEIEKLSSFLPDKFVNLMFIDPPYNINKKFNLISFKSMQIKAYELWLEKWFSKIINTLKDTASVYICGDWKSTGAILNVGTKYLEVKNRITWEREKGRGAKTNWKNCSEDIWFFTRSKDYTFNIDDVKLRRKVLAPYRDGKGNPKDWTVGENVNFRDTSPSNIWTDISVPFWSMPENTDHPTQKPEKLLAKIILAGTNEGDVVFDPFLGSGTTAVVAKKLNRNFVGVDIDEYYCCLALKRLRDAENNEEIQGYSKNVFWERNTLLDQKKYGKNKSTK